MCNLLVSAVTNLQAGHTASGVLEPMRWAFYASQLPANTGASWQVHTVTSHGDCDLFIQHGRVPTHTDFVARDIRYKHNMLSENDQNGCFTDLDLSALLRILKLRLHSPNRVNTSQACTRLQEGTPADTISLSVLMVHNHSSPPFQHMTSKKECTNQIFINFSSRWRKLP